MVVQSVTMIFTTVMRIIVTGNLVYSKYTLVISTKQMCIMVFTAHIILFFKSMNALRRKYSQMMGEIDEFVHFKSVPVHLRLRMQQYYHFMYHGMFHNETEVWSRVSDRMKAVSVDAH